LDVFGASISLSGSLLAIGAPREGSGDPNNPNDNSAPLSGAVYVYSRDATGSFANPIYVKSPQIAEDAGFGFSVGVNDDHLVVGAASENSGLVKGADLLGDGAVYLFRRTADGWHPEQSLKGKHPQPTGLFGFSVSPVSAGSFLIGAPGESDCEYSGGGATVGRGNAYRVHQVAGEWVEDCLGPDSGIAQVLFGFSVAAHGDQYAVGAPWDSSALISDPSNHSMGAAGAAYLVGRGTGSKEQYVKAPRPRPSAFGYSLALDAGRLVVGAAYEADPTADSRAVPPDAATSAPTGAVYVFGLN
jgi:hypothetical protein